MPARIVRRPATPDEREALEKMLAEIPTDAIWLKQNAKHALFLWGFGLFAVGVVWRFLGWIVYRMMAVNLGLHSAATWWVAGFAVPACAIGAVVFVIKEGRGWRNFWRPAALREDLAAGEISEEQYTFTDAKRFQEQEHGGLIYFLRSAEDEVFTIYDDESEDLGIDGKDPLQSSYRPQSHLLIVRAPKSRWILSDQPSGVVLDAGPVLDLLAEKWPDDQELCDIPWRELEARLGSPDSVSGKGKNS